MKVFLTGGTGFIGSYVTKELSEKGHEVTVLARNPDKVPELSRLEGVSIVPGLLTDLDVLEDTLRDKDACVHIALGWGDLATSMLKNDTFPSVFLFETAGRLGIKHFIYTSSTAACGNLSSTIDEKARPEPSDYYGATKASSEMFLNAISYRYPMRCNVIRPGYTFGNPAITGAPIEPDDRFKNIARHAVAGEEIHVIQYDGTQFINASDLAKLYAAVLESDKNRNTYFAIGTKFYSWEQVAEKAIELTGSKSTVHLEDRGYSKKPLLYEVGLIKRDFGLEPKSWDAIVEHLQYLISISG